MNLLQYWKIKVCCIVLQHWWISIGNNRDYRPDQQKGDRTVFERVKGSPYPVLINAFGSFERMSLALGVQQLDEIGARISKCLSFRI